MGASFDGPNVTSSLGQRRQATSNLPQFELPPPPNLQLAAQQLGHKFPPLSLVGHGQPPPAVSVGNLLTPPSNSASESGASSLNIPHGITPNSQSMPVLPYSPAFWGPGTTPGYGTGLTPQPWQNNPLYGTRSMFSPGLLNRHQSNSPAAGEGSSLPPPPFELNATHGYPTSMGIHSPQGSAQHQAMSNMMPLRPHSQASPISPHDGVSKPSPAPGLYSSLSASNTPQPPQYGFQSTTPVSQASHPGNPASRISPPIHQGPMSQMSSQNHFIKPPYPSQYSLPQMTGPVMTNVHSPGSQMSMVGNAPHMLPMGFNSGFAANPQAMYAAQQRANSPAQPATNDRPFKCDQCPQSFNRNHDLKRHKRIHLAVKPFPCKHCDKSFSRKDALKRHILVKGCGNSGSNDNDTAKSETGSDSISGDVSQVSVVA